MTDLQARLDAAITEERSRVLAYDREFQSDVLYRFEALVAACARLEGYRMGWNDRNSADDARSVGLTAEAERLLEDA